MLAECAGIAGAAFHTVIASLPDVDLACDVKNPAEVLQGAEAVQPDLVLLSHALMRSEFLKVVREIRTRLPYTKVITTSTCNDSRMALRAIEAGASGYLLEDRAFEELGKAFRVVLSGWTYLSPGIAGLEKE